jgi:hypothetical protein
MSKIKEKNIADIVQRDVHRFIGDGFTYKRESLIGMKEVKTKNGVAKVPAAKIDLLCSSKNKNYIIEVKRGPNRARVLYGFTQLLMF